MNHEEKPDGPDSIYFFGDGVDDWDYFDSDEHPDEWQPDGALEDGDMREPGSP
jgi:hypothetical protein